MPGERMYPILPCPDLDQAIAFYAALGFTPTYRQLRPNPHAVAIEGLAGVTEVAARLADAHGDDAPALRTLEQGLRRYGDASPLDRAHALLYRAELAVRSGNLGLARASLEEARDIDLGAEAQKPLAAEFAHVESLLEGL